MNRFVKVTLRGAERARLDRARTGWAAIRPRHPFVLLPLALLLSNQLWQAAPPTDKSAGLALSFYRRRGKFDSSGRGRLTRGKKCGSWPVFACRLSVPDRNERHCAGR